MYLLALSLCPIAPAIGGDAETVSFQQDVLPTLKKRCVICHLTGEEPGYMSLTQEQAWRDLVGRDAVAVDMKRVVAGDPEASYLLYKLKGTHRQVGGTGLRMPMHQPPLSASLIAQFETWITAGAENN